MMNKRYLQYFCSNLAQRTQTKTAIAIDDYFNKKT